MRCSRLAGDPRLQSGYHHSFQWTLSCNVKHVCLFIADRCCVFKTAQANFRRIWHICRSTYHPILSSVQSSSRFSGTWLNPSKMNIGSGNFALGSQPEEVLLSNR
ncbi:hypothetical protein CPB84DRAFT_1820847, partial [Gymnopilus junonius]